MIRECKFLKNPSSLGKLLKSMPNTTEHDSVGKIKKKNYKDMKKDLQSNSVSRVLEDINKQHFEYYAVGLDMAAAEENWGLSIIGIQKDFTQGKLLLLLPHREEIPGFRAHCPMKASQDYLKSLLEGLISKPIVIAVDVPLGWPRNHGSFTSTWSAKNGTQEQFEFPSREDFEFRLTDIKLRDLMRNIDPSASMFSVGADKIASAAFKWAEFRNLYPNLNIISDVGLSEALLPNGISLFETYPAAYVRLNYNNFIQYKSGVESANIRRGLLDQLQKDYGVCIDDSLKNHVHQACSSPRSDAFDGFLSAMSAWDYLRWKISEHHSHFMTAPERLLNRNIDTKNNEHADLIQQIESEGWILVRNSKFEN